VAEERPKIRFWTHQAAEYVIGVLVLSQALQAEQPLVPVVAAVGVMLLAATADGPLAAFAAVPRPVHRVLDIVAAIALVVLAIGFRDGLDSLGIALLVGSGLALGVLVYRTDYRPPPRRRPSTAPPPPTSTTRTEDVGRAAGRALGRSIRAYKRRDRP